MPRYYNDTDRPTPEQSFQKIVLGYKEAWNEKNRMFLYQTIFQLPAEPVEVEPIRPAPILHLDNAWETAKYVNTNCEQVMIEGTKFVLVKCKNNFLTKVMWSLLFCLFTLPAFSQFPSFIAGERDGLQYTLDQDLLCLYQVESGIEIGLLLTLDVAIWDDNGFTTEVTPRFDPAQEPAAFIRWVSFYHATDPETQNKYQIALYFEWRSLQKPKITKIEIKGGFPRPSGRR